MTVEVGFSAIFFPIIIQAIRARAGAALAAKAVSRCPPLRMIPRPIPIIIRVTQPMPKTRRECVSAPILARVLAIFLCSWFCRATRLCAWAGVQGGGYGLGVYLIKDVGCLEIIGNRRGQDKPPDDLSCEDVFLSLACLRLDGAGRSPFCVSDIEGQRGGHLIAFDIQERPSGIAEFAVGASPLTGRSVITTSSASMQSFFIPDGAGFGGKFDNLIGR